MEKLPDIIKLSPHAKERLKQRKKDDIKYDMQNLMQSPVKWYKKDDLIYDCALYRHCCYTTRQSNQVGYITDGNIEIIYNKKTYVAITILEVKDKFKPIEQFIQSKILKKEKQIKMKTELNSSTTVCADCGKEAITNSNGVCVKCFRRKINMKSRGKEYVRYLDLSEEEKKRIDKAIEGQSKRHKKETITEPEPELTVPNNDCYYEAKANQTELEVHPMMKPIQKTEKELLLNQDTFIKILRDCGCEIPEDSLEDVLDILTSTNKLKDIIITIAKGDSQQAMLDLEQALNVVERKLQHDWEFNGFQESDDIKFKGFLTWRRVLKGAIFFWKKLYQTNTIIEMQRAWNAYIKDPNDKILLAGDKIDSAMKRFQITTDTISTILNTKRPFTRVFYATNKDIAYNTFKQWLNDRNLHEDPSKTTIVELKNDNSEDGRKE